MTHYANILIWNTTELSFFPQKVGHFVFIKSITLVNVLALNSGASDLLWTQMIWVHESQNVLCKLGSFTNISLEKSGIFFFFLNVAVEGTAWKGPMMEEMSLVPH